MFMLLVRVRLQSKLQSAASLPKMCSQKQENSSGDVRDEILEVARSGQQGAPYYQAKELQEDEVIEEHDAVGQQRPPHVPHRFRLIGAWKTTTTTTTKDTCACKRVQRKPSIFKMSQI